MAGRRRENRVCRHAPQSGFRAETKFEYRNSKLETNSKQESAKVQNRNITGLWFWSFGFVSLTIASDFALRTSHFQFLRKLPRSYRRPF